MNDIVMCPKCQYTLLPDWYFCPNCSNPVQEKPIQISILKQLFIYFVSFVFAPFGLAWGMKYIRSHDTKVRIVGFISIVLTVLSFVLLFFAFKNIMDQYGKIINSLSPY